MNVSKVLKWLEEESDRLTEECHSNSDPYKTVNNSFLEGFNYALANVQGLEQPQLNENQQIVLEWLKSTWTERKNMHWFPFEVIKLLDHQFAVAWGNVDFEEFKQIEKAKPYIKAYGELTAVEQLPVLQAFSQWALEQEEE